MNYLLQDPLLDEPINSLDPATESLVMEAFARLSENRTLIVASHQLKVVANADTILVFAVRPVSRAGNT